MKELFYVAITILLASCAAENVKETIEKTPALMPVNEVKGTFDSEIQRPTFTSVASSYKTSRMPDFDFDLITNIEMQDLICESEDISSCDEFTSSFNSSSGYSFIASEENASIVEERKNVFKIKGSLVSGEIKASAILLFTVFESHFKGNIIIDMPETVVGNKQKNVTITVKGKRDLNKM